MEKQYKGIIVEESLDDNRILNDLEIIGFKISEDEKLEDRWHLYTVIVSKDNIEKLSKQIKQKWYMHFWNDKEILVIFKDKIFEFNHYDKTSWEEAVKYGLSIGISEDQLDFVIEE